jgi:hypothetical protein
MAEPEPPDTLLTTQEKGSHPTALPLGDIGQIFDQKFQALSQTNSC